MSEDGRPVVLDADVISERTVETHVSRILGKLRVESRAAVGMALAARSRPR